MHDLRALRENPDVYREGWRARGVQPDPLPEILALDERLRAAQTALQTAQSRRNEASKLIGQAKARKDEAAAARLMAEVESDKEEIGGRTEEAKILEAELQGRLSSLPNLAAPGVPEGPDESANVEVRRRGEPPPIAAPKDHVDLGEALGLMDFEAAARMSGARFVVLKGQLARLERALAQFMLDLQTSEHGYTEVSPPVMVRDEAVFGTGQLPKFAEDLFRTGDGRWLIPTAEVSLTNLVREQITGEDQLPLRLTACTPCFRARPGPSGRDTRGMIRQHQFLKVELVSITAPEQSDGGARAHDRLRRGRAQRLELPYRSVQLCTGDMGFSARKTFDLEVWLPSQNTYREISSCSNCGDFQARPHGRALKRAAPRGRSSCTRSTARAWRRPHAGGADGDLPGRGGPDRRAGALQPYMGGLTHIGGGQ
jgi:seryl-tRNA synthetase